jgi:hypothetical protein
MTTQLVDAILKIGGAKETAWNEKLTPPSSQGKGPVDARRSGRGPILIRGAGWASAVALAAALLGSPSTTKAESYTWSLLTATRDGAPAHGEYWTATKPWKSTTGKGFPGVGPNDNANLPGGTFPVLLNQNENVNVFAQTGSTLVGLTPGTTPPGIPAGVAVSGSNLVVNGMLTWLGGEERNVKNLKDGSTSANGGFDISGGAILNARTLYVNSTGTLSKGGMAGYQGAVIVTAANGGLLQITDNSSLKAPLDAQTMGGPPLFINKGGFVKQGGNDNSDVQWTFRNYGTVLVNTGTVTFATADKIPKSTFTQYAGVTTLNNTTISTGGKDQPFTIKGGDLTGSGTINGKAYINGEVAPNGGGAGPGGGAAAPGGGLASAALAGDSSAGKFEITGGLVLQDGATLKMKIGGTAPGSSDFIRVDSDATLGGILSLSFINGFQNLVTPSDVITILTAATPLTGVFSDVANGGRLETTDGDYSFQVNYGSGSLYDPNSVVLSNFLPEGSNTAVPEPASLVLAGIGAVGVVCYAWRTRRPGEA